MDYRLHTPLTKEQLAPLCAGDRVLLSGTVYTARDAAHMRLIELLDAGAPFVADTAEELTRYLLSL